MKEIDGEWVLLQRRQILSKKWMGRILLCKGNGRMAKNEIPIRPNRLVLCTISKMTVRTRRIVTGQKLVNTGTTSKQTEKSRRKNGLRINTTYSITTKWRLVRISSMYHYAFDGAKISWAKKAVDIGWVEKDGKRYCFYNGAAQRLGDKQRKKVMDVGGHQGHITTGKVSSRTMASMRSSFVSVTLAGKITSPLTLWINRSWRFLTESSTPRFYWGGRRRRCRTNHCFN